MKFSCFSSAERGYSLSSAKQRTLPTAKCRLSSSAVCLPFSTCLSCALPEGKGLISFVRAQTRRLTRRQQVRSCFMSRALALYLKTAAAHAGGLLHWAVIFGSWWTCGRRKLIQTQWQRTSNISCQKHLMLLFCRAVSSSPESSLSSQAVTCTGEVLTGRAVTLLSRSTFTQLSLGWPGRTSGF